MTKQHVLHQNFHIPSSNDVSEPGNRYWSTSSPVPSETRFKSRTSVSLPRRPLQANLTKLDRILHDLDEIDGYSEGYESQG